jgi:predicted nucleic acid-binding protein
MINPNPDKPQVEVKRPTRKAHRALLTSFAVVLDACVLCNSTVRDFLLWAADVALFRPVWSRETIEEVQRVLLGRGFGLAPERVDYLIGQMRTAFPEAEVQDYERLLPVVANDESDRHVIAAAIASGAQLIVTNNLRHFPEETLRPHHLEACSPDEVLRDLLDLDPERMIDVLATIAERRKCPPKSIDELLEALSSNGCPGFANDLRDALRKHYVDS